MMDASDKDNNMTHTLSSSYKHPIVFDDGAEDTNKFKKEWWWDITDGCNPRDGLS